MNSVNSDNPIIVKTFQFSLDVIKYVKILKEDKHYIIADQLLRASTSIGANVMEAQQAESKKDFIHKMKISAKEAIETEYWMRLCLLSEGFPKPKQLLSDLNQIQRLLTSIISTTKKQLAN